MSKKLQFTVITILMTMVCARGASAAEEIENPAPANDREEITQQMRETREQLRKVKKELSRIERKYRADPDVVEAKRVMEEARKAYNDLIEQRVAEDPDAPALLAQERDLDKKYKELGKRFVEVMREAAKTEDIPSSP